MRRNYKKQSATVFILKALIPYSRQNLLLSFKPNKFFNELERNTRYNQNTLRNAYWRAAKDGYIGFRGEKPNLTEAGFERVLSYKPKYLGKSASLIVIFDIPEDMRKARHQLRELLKSWEFVQIQKSVWATDMDYRELLVEAVAELELTGCVEIYESVRLFPKTRG